MAGIKQFKAWFFQLVPPVSRPDGSTGGVRLRKGDQPSQQTLENLAVSATFSKESGDRAKVTTGSTDLGTEQGLVVLATDVQAKANQTQLSDRSLVVQPSQLPTVANSTGNADTITNNIDTFTGDALLITLDATSTRNSYVGKLSTSFITWFSGVLNTINVRLLSAPFFNPNSTDTETYSLGTKTFVLNYDPTQNGGINFTKGLRVRGFTSGFSVNFIEGTITSISSGPSAGQYTMVLEVDNFVGSGSVSLWFFRLGGAGEVVRPLIGGTAKQILAKVSSGLFDYTWFSFDSLTPDQTGNAGKYLKTDGTNSSWQSVVASGNTFNTSSVTPQDITFSSPKAFAVATGLSWLPGNSIKAYSFSNSANFINGKVFSYSVTSLYITVDVIGGSGTGITDWILVPGNSSDLSVGSDAFTVVSFPGGTTSGVTSSITYSRGNGMINLGFVVNYTSVLGFPNSTLLLSLPAYLLPSTSGFKGTASVGTQSSGSIVAFPFNISTVGGVGLNITAPDTSNGFPTGIQKVTGSIIYPY